MLLEPEFPVHCRFGDRFDDCRAVARAVAQRNQFFHEGVGLVHFETLRADAETFRGLPPGEGQRAGLVVFAPGRDAPRAHGEVDRAAKIVFHQTTLDVCAGLGAILPCLRGVKTAERLLDDLQARAGMSARRGKARKNPGGGAVGHRNLRAVWLGEKSGTSVPAGAFRDRQRRDLEITENRGVDVALERDGGVAKQGVAKSPVAHEVQGLLSGGKVEGERFQRLSGPWRKVVHRHRGRVGIAEVGQPVRRGRLEEFGEIECLIFLLQKVVCDVTVIGFAQRLELLPQKPVVGRLPVARFQEELDERFALINFGTDIAKPGGVHPHHVAQQAAYAPTGLAIIADVGHAAGLQALPAKAKNGLSDLLRHPRIDAVRDDVIEFAEVHAHIGDVCLEEARIAQACGRPRFVSQLHVAAREIDSDKFGPGIQLCHGQKIDAAAATYLQNARLTRIGGRQGKNATDRCQSRDVRGRKTVGRVGEFFVG